MRSPRRRSATHAAGPDSRRRLTIVLVAVAAVAVLVGLGPVASSLGGVRTVAADAPAAGRAAVPAVAALQTEAPVGRAVTPPAPVAVAPAGTSAAVAPASTTTPTTTAPTTTTSRAGRAAAATDSGPAAQVVALTNAARAEAGCDPLTVDRRLTRAAQEHSEDQAARGVMSHTGSDGSDFVARIEAAGHPSPGAENVAAGQRSAQAVVTAWLNSPPHRKNILDCGLRTIGVGLAQPGTYWTQDFGR